MMKSPMKSNFNSPKPAYEVFDDNRYEPSCHTVVHCCGQFVACRKAHTHVMHRSPESGYLEVEERPEYLEVEEGPEYLEVEGVPKHLEDRPVEGEPKFLEVKGRPVEGSSKYLKVKGRPVEEVPKHLEVKPVEGDSEYLEAKASVYPRPCPQVVLLTPNMARDTPERVYGNRDAPLVDSEGSVVVLASNTDRQTR